MAESLADWLEVREPADTAARCVPLTQLIAGTIPVDEPVNVLDLATGTGANIRYLLERLPGRQRWLVVDRNPDLLALQTRRVATWAAPRGYHLDVTPNGFCVSGKDLGCEVETLRRDLGELDDAALFEGRHLVTASALLDLVSERWLRTLAARCHASGASALLALTYNGESTCAPIEAEDDLIRDLLNRHQRTDKGLGGPAAGPDAVSCAERSFTEMGYHVRVAPADWAVAPAQHELQRQLINGWADAAGELAPELTATIANWRQRRMAHLDAGHSHIVVRHHDLAAWPADPDH
ncbi:MAG: class I SAM-dependent methyltransferase [Vicinamibacterales bacterium]